MIKIPHRECSTSKLWLVVTGRRVIKMAAIVMVVVSCEDGDIMIVMIVIDLKSCGDGGSDVSNGDYIGE